MATKCNKFEFCDTCINREFDPSQCEWCDDGENYEDEDSGEELTLTEFKDLLLREAA